MGSYVGPNGRLYKRDRRHAKWMVGAAVLAVAFVAAMLVGVPI
jgi:hypothetical protein